MRAFTLLLLIPAVTASPARAAERKPNVVVVLADQWRAQAGLLTHAGVVVDRTAAIDARCLSQ